MLTRSYSSIFMRTYADWVLCLTVLLIAFIGFEKDGMMTGYTGCSSSHANWPHWQASLSNGATELRPDLCQDGKYGYDARCSGWYGGGMERGGVYITPPYQFASSDTCKLFAGERFGAFFFSFGGSFFFKIFATSVAASGTYSLIDPMSKEHVGQVLLDFLPDAFMKAVNANNTPIGTGITGFPIVITPQPDVSLCFSQEVSRFLR